MVMGQSGAVWDTLREYGVELRALKRRVEAFSAGDSIRADMISGVIPDANVPVYWWYNGNLLGAGTKVDLIAGAGVWISGAFIVDRAYYYIGAYATGGGPGGGISGVDFSANGAALCLGAGIDLQEAWGVWISGSCAGGEATYKIGAYSQGGGGGASGTVAFYVDDVLFCSALEAELAAGTGIWISGTCESGNTHARFEIGAYPSAGGGDDILALTYAVAF